MLPLEVVTAIAPKEGGMSSPMLVEEDGVEAVEEDEALIMMCWLSMLL